MPHFRSHIWSERILRSSEAPDTSGQNAAALQQVQLSKDQLAWAQQIYGETAGERAAATATAQQTSETQLAALQKQGAIADQASADYTNTYRPIEQKLAADAVGYDTPERREAAAAAARSDVEQTVAQQRQASLRESERAGVNPASGRIAALQGSYDLGTAKLKAGASNVARTQVETIGAAKMADAANLGRGIASSQGTNAALALTTGNSAVGNATTAATTAASGAGIVQQGYSGASSSLNSAASIYGNIAQTQAGVSSSNSGNITAGIGAAGTAAAIFF